MLRIAKAQFGSTDDSNRNLELFRSAAEQGAEQGSKITCLPELANTTYFCWESKPQHFALADPIRHGHRPSCPKAPCRAADPLTQPALLVSQVPVALRKRLVYEYPAMKIPVESAIDAALGNADLSERTLEDAVTDALRDAIVTARFLPGAELRQSALAEHLGVSRIPLRDALHRLEVEGLVSIDGRRGARVSALSADEITNIYEVRILLEPEAARRAVGNLDEDSTERLLRLSESMDRASHDAALGHHSRNAFYAELYRHCGNPRMALILQRLRDDVSRYHVLAGSESVHAHSAQRALLARRDSEAFAADLRRHLETVREDLVATLEKEDSG